MEMFSKKSGNVVALGEQKSRLFEMKFGVVYATDVGAPEGIFLLTEKLKLWHDWLEYQNIDKITKALISNDISFSKKENIHCKACIYDKQHRLPSSAVQCTLYKKFM